MAFPSDKFDLKREVVGQVAFMGRWPSLSDKMDLLKHEFVVSGPGHQS